MTALSSFGIIVAGGQGTRIGLKKQYIKLGAKEVWERSADAVLEAGVQRLALVVPSADVPQLRTKIGERSWGDICVVVPGGDSRYASVRAGFLALSEWFGTQGMGAVVLVHDAARPFVRVEDVRSVMESAREHGGAILAQRCVDTVKQESNGWIEGTIPRERLWLAQTPQAFRWSWMTKAYIDDPPSIEPTDDASLMEAMGYRVQLVAATGPNMKITTLPDLELAHWLASRRWGEE